MDGKLIVLLLLMVIGIACFFWGSWKLLILFIVNALYFMFVIFANHTTTSDLIIPALIGVTIYFWMDKADKIDKKQ